MPPDYYSNSADPSNSSNIDSSVIRAEYAAIALGFSKIAGYTGNGGKIVGINAGGTQQAVFAVTGTGSVVLATSPTLVTPALGVATATSINKVAISAPATGATLTIADGKTLTANATLTLAGTDGKTLTVSNNVTLAGTDGTVMTFPGTSATIARTDAANTFTGLQTFSTGITSTAASNSFGASVFSGNITSSGNPSLNIGSGALTAGAGSFTTGAFSGALTLGAAADFKDSVYQTAHAGANRVAYYSDATNITFSGTTQWVLNNQADNLVILRALNTGAVTIPGTLGVTGTITGQATIAFAGTGQTTTQQTGTMVNTGGSLMWGVDRSAGGWIGVNVPAYASAIGSQNATEFHIVTGSTPTSRIGVGATGIVTIANLAGAGSRAVNADANGVLSAASDSSLKREVTGAYLPGRVEVLQLRPRAYQWLKDIENRGDAAAVEIGFFADQVAPIIPSAAPKNRDGTYGFYDRSVTAALVMTAQDHDAKLESLLAWKAKATEALAANNIVLDEKKE